MTIYIINPNSSRLVTDGIDRALEPLRAASPVPIAAIQLDEGPKGIETQAHVDGVVSPLLARAASLEAEASAFVTACFSDPGLAALREQSRHPVLGIAESAILTAMTLGQSVRHPVHSLPLGPAPHAHARRDGGDGSPRRRSAARTRRRRTGGRRPDPRPPARGRKPPARPPWGGGRHSRLRRNGEPPRGPFDSARTAPWSSPAKRPPPWRSAASPSARAHASTKGPTIATSH